MMFTYWLPGHSHPMLLQSPLRCALSLGDLPADPFFHQFHQLEMLNPGDMAAAAAHSFPLMRTTSKRGKTSAIGQQWKEERGEEVEEEEDVEMVQKRSLPIFCHSIGTQTDDHKNAEHQKVAREWIDEEMQNEEDEPELDDICAEIAVKLLAMADRWEAEIESRKAAKRNIGNGSDWGLWAWMRGKLFG